MAESLVAVIVAGVLSVFVSDLPSVLLSGLLSDLRPPETLESDAGRMTDRDSSSWSTFLLRQKHPWGDLRYKQLAERVIQGHFGNSEGPKPVGFSHSDFNFVVQAFDYAAGERFSSPKVVEDEFAARA